MNKNNNKTSSMLYSLAAACFYIVATIGFINDKSFSPLFLCLGSAFLCLGAATLDKTKKDTAMDKDNTNNVKHT